ncbi:MAG: alpha/beta hydrolase [Chloroflexota bacterium]
MSAVVIDGGLVHYEAFGRGRPVLFLHGWLGSWRYWMSTMEAISHKNRTYAIDLWGFGDSDKSKQRYNISDYIDLVDHFLDNMGISEAPIIGHSLGATVALEYAVRNPERVSKLMTVSLPLNTDAINRKLTDLAHQSMLSKVMWWRQITHKEVQKETEKTDNSAIDISLQSVAQMNIAAYIETLGQADNSIMLLTHGDKDDIIDPTPTVSLDGKWENIRPIGLSDSKHFPMLDEAAKFHRLLQDFLETNENLSDLELKEEWRRRTR